MWQGDYPFLGYQVYSLGNQETGQYESGGSFVLPNIIGGCEEGFEIDPETQTCVSKKQKSVQNDEENAYSSVSEVFQDPYVQWAIGVGVVGFLVNLSILKKDLSGN